MVCPSMLAAGTFEGLERSSDVLGLSLDILFVLFIGSVALAFLCSGGFIHGLRRRRWRMRKRYACELPAVLIHRSRTISARLIDVSASGARLMPTSIVSETEPVTLRLLGRDVPARIIWTGDAMVGIRFDKALPFAYLTAILRSGAMKKGRWGLGSKEISGARTQI
jgi:hypothetical protein